MSTQHFRRACLASLEAARRVHTSPRHYGPSIDAGLFLEYTGGDVHDAKTRALALVRTLDSIINEENAPDGGDETQTKEEHEHEDAR